MRQDFTYPQDFSEEVFDIKIILHLLRRYWYIIAIGIMVSLIFETIVYKYQNPIYKAQLKILLIDNLSLQTEIFLNEFKFLTHERKLDIEIEKLKSYTVVNEVIDSLDFTVSYFVSHKLKDEEIYKDDFPYTVKSSPLSLRFLHIPFFIKKINADTCLLIATGENVSVYDPLRNKVLIKSIPELSIQQKIAFGQAFRSNGLNLTVSKNNDSTIQYNDDESYYFKMNDPNVLTRTYFGNLDIKPLDKQSSILVVSLEGSVIEKNIGFLNKLAELYIKNDENEKQQIASNTINYLDKQISETINRKDRILDSLNNFKICHKVLDFENAYNDLAQKKAELENQKYDIAAALEKYNNLIKYISGINCQKGTASPSIAGINDQQLNDLISRLSEITEKGNALHFFSENNHPQSEFYKAQFNNLKAAIIENLNNTVISFNASLDYTEKYLEEINTEIFQLAGQGTEYNKIKQNFDFEEVKYQYFIEKRIEADIARSSRDSVFVSKRILENAELSSVKQVFPRKNLAFIISILIGLCCSTGLVYLIYTFKNTIISKEDVERITAVPIIGSVSHCRNKEQIIMNRNMQNTVVESFRKIKANLQYLLNGKDTGVIAFTSSIVSEGKTFNALLLSRVFALSGKKTILLEIDLRRPKIKAIFQSDSEKGLSNYLVNSATEDEIIQFSKIDNLSYIHSGPVPPNPNELLNNGLLTKLMNSLKCKFDYIIIDAPPMGLVADFFSVSDFTDICIYMVRKDVTQRNMLQSLNKCYNEKQIKNVQIVLNDFTDETNRYGYYN